MFKILVSSKISFGWFLYNFFDKTSKYPYITLPNDLNQKVTVKNVSKGKVNNVKVLSGGDSYKVGDRLVFDQKGSGGSGVAAKVSFVKGKEISSIENVNTEIPIEIYPSRKKGTFVGFYISEYLNKDMLIGLAIINPVYFFCMMIGAMKNVSISLAVILGTVLGPVIYLVSTEWALLFAGLIAGTIAFLFGEKNGK